VAFLTLGDVISAAIYQSGRFSSEDTIYVWGTLAGSSIGLLASTLGRLYSSAYYALRDTRTPLYYAVMRVIFATILGYVFALPLPPLLGVHARWGVAGLTIASGIAGWVEFVWLRYTLNRRIGHTGVPLSFLLPLWSAAIVGAVAAWMIKLFIGPQHPILRAVLILTPYALIYMAIAYKLHLPEAQMVVRRFLRFTSRHQSLG
jgi:putative peptidoglycan lipid II flippase